MLLPRFCWLMTGLLTVGLAGATGAEAPATDADGMPLPAGAVARLGARPFFTPNMFSFALSPDGKRLATASREEVRVWDVATRKITQKLTVQGQPLAFSPDNAQLLLGNEQDDMSLWDIAQAKELRRIPGTRGLFAPDGKVLASGGYDTKEQFWVFRLIDPATGKELHQLIARPASLDTGGFEFAPDGKAVAAASPDGLVHIWDVVTGKEQRRLEGHRAAVRSVAFAPDGKQLASSGRDGTVRLWDAATGKELRRWEEAASFLVAFAADGKTLYSADRDTCRRYDPANGTETGVVRLSAGTGPANAILCGRAGLLARIIGPGNALSMQLWDLSTGQELAPSAPRAEVLSLLSAPDGQSLATGSNDKAVYLWDIRSGKLRQRLVGHVGAVRAVAFAPDGGRLASAATGDLVVNVWETATGKVVGELPGHQNTNHLRFQRDGAELLTSAGGLLRRWDVAANKELSEQRHPGGLGSFSADGRLATQLALSGAEVQVVDLETGKALRKVALAKNQRPAAHHLSADGARLIVVNAPEFVDRPNRPTIFELFDTATGKRLRSFGEEPKRDDFGSRISVGALSPDGRVLAEAQSSKAVRFWELSTGKVRRQLEGHESFVQAMAFSPDGRSFASAGTDRSAIVWDTYGILKDGAPAPLRLTPAQLDALWNDLGDADATKGFTAIGSLIRGAEQAVPFLAGRLRPTPAADPKRVAALIVDLDDKEAAVRQKATEELEAIGEPAIAALQKVLKEGKPALELSKRLEAILQRVEGGQPSADRLRHWRALEVLEVIGSAEVRDIVKTVAGGVAESRLTQDAKATLERLTRKSK